MIEIEGTVITCKCVAVDKNICSYNAEVTITKQMISKVLLFDVTRELFDYVREKTSVVLCLKKEEEYITVITGYLSSYSFRHCEGDFAEETSITLKYISSRLLYGYNCIDEKMMFNSFSCEITDGIELIGVCPFEHKEEGDDWHKQIISEGKMIYKDTSLGMSYFVAPYVEKTKQGLVLKSQYKIQYRKENEFDIFHIEEIARQIVLFFEILCGEQVTIIKLDVHSNNSIAEYIGVSNLIKKELRCLKTGEDTTSYLRQSVFKLSDFGDNLESALQRYLEFQRDNHLAYESYKQVLLDEEVMISTYNKFLKVMQLVEGYQREKVDEEIIEEFNKKKKEIIGKLEDEGDVSLVSKFMNYNGETFRKCLNKFTYDAINIISNISKTKAMKAGDVLINKIINDRDTYTHASKNIQPCLTLEEIGNVIKCYKTFFRVLNLSEFGLQGGLIRKRLLFDRSFVDSYKQLFGLEVMTNNSDYFTGKFDELMWGYNEKIF